MLNIKKMDEVENNLVEVNDNMVEVENNEMTLEKILDTTIFTKTLSTYLFYDDIIRCRFVCKNFKEKFFHCMVNKFYMDYDLTRTKKINHKRLSIDMKNGAGKDIDPSLISSTIESLYITYKHVNNGDSFPTRQTSLDSIMDRLSNNDVYLRDLTIESNDRTLYDINIDGLRYLTTLSTKGIDTNKYETLPPFVTSLRVQYGNIVNVHRFEGLTHIDITSYYFNGQILSLPKSIVDLRLSFENPIINVDLKGCKHLTKLEISNATYIDLDGCVNLKFLKIIGIIERYRYDELEYPGNVISLPIKSLKIDMSKNLKSDPIIILEINNIEVLELRYVTISFSCVKNLKMLKSLSFNSSSYYLSNILKDLPNPSILHTIERPKNNMGFQDNEIIDAQRFINLRSLKLCGLLIKNPPISLISLSRNVFEDKQLNSLINLQHLDIFLRTFRFSKNVLSFVKDTPYLKTLRISYGKFDPDLKPLAQCKYLETITFKTNISYAKGMLECLTNESLTYLEFHKNRKLDELDIPLHINTIGVKKDRHKDYRHHKDREEIESKIFERFTISNYVKDKSPLSKKGILIYKRILRQTQT
jgi:hypothetical protein